EPTGSGSLRMGSGAKVVKVARINNPPLARQIGKEQTAKGYLEGMASGMNRVEQVVNEQIVDGLNTSISQFFNAFRELSNNPENTATRTLVAESAAFMARDFNRVHQNFTGIQDDLDRQ